MFKEFNNNEQLYNSDELSYITQFQQEESEIKESLQKDIWVFKYKNRSRNGEFFVFSYDALSWETQEEIKQKYIDCFWWNIHWILLTDITWKEINNWEDNESKKIYVKAKISDYPYPLKFIDFGVLSGNSGTFSCFINTPGWTPSSIKQMYQDEFDQVENNLIITNKEWIVYDEETEFKSWTTVFVRKSIPLGTTPPFSESEITSDDNKLESENTKSKESSKEREGMKVSRYQEKILNQIKPETKLNGDKKEISITFDDGYGRENIVNILNVLKENGIHATFFILGDCIQKSSELWKRAIDEWHEICCHTYSHIYFSDWDITSLFKWHGISESNRIEYVIKWEKDIKRLLWLEYYNKLKSDNPDAPDKVKSATLLEAEILMWEEEVKLNLGEEYLQKMKINSPFFRFPWWCWVKNSESISILKKHWYLSVWWSEDFMKGWHMSNNAIKTMEIPNWWIPLFHFKKDDIPYLKSYLENLSNQWKTSKTLSETIEP